MPATKERAEILPAPGDIRSKRGRQRFGFADADQPLLTQITPMQTQALNIKESGFAYYCNTNGATLREAIVLYPNGAPTKHDSGVAERESMRERGFEYIGPQLTKDGLRLIMKTIQENTPDYLLYLHELITECDSILESSFDPRAKDGAVTRRAKLLQLVKQAEQPVNWDAMFTELDEYAKAQRMAALPPEMREALAYMLDDREKGLIDRIIAASGISDPELATMRTPNAKDPFVEKDGN